MTAVATTSPDLNTKFNLDGTTNTINNNPPVYTLFDLEKIVVINLNNFYKKFAIYLRCSSDITNGTGDNDVQYNTLASDVKYNAQNQVKQGCNTDGATTSGTTNLNNLKTAYNELKNSIDAFNNAVTFVKTTSGGIRNDDYQSKYNAIVSKHQDILRVREDIDDKLRNIDAVDKIEKRPGNPRVQDVFIYHDATIYSSLMITVLATSLLYYAFVKM